MKFIDYCPPIIIIIIGIIIIFPPKPEPICPQCGSLFDFVFSKIAAVLYIGIGALATYAKIKGNQQIKG